jgi:hypothetical protein
MDIAVLEPLFAHERKMVMDFASTCVDIGHTVRILRKGEEPKHQWLNSDIRLVWGTHETSLPPSERNIYFELGWLPRWHYQVSHTGINARHHLAGSELPTLTHSHRVMVSELLESVRLGIGSPGWGYLSISAPPFPYVPGDGFVLAPLQMEMDTNMENVPEHLRTNQGFVDAVSAMNLPWKVVFKQHPHSLAAYQMGLEMRRPGDKVYLHKSAHVYSYLKSGKCRGVITLNSNVAHDALLYDIPVVTLGTGFWPEGVFLNGYDGFDFTTWDQRADKRTAYLVNLTMSQWKQSDAQLHSKVAHMIDLAERNAYPHE